jgi:alginate O-acetyltransferase complex protein AlgI
MVFNSLAFALFFPAVLLLYYGLPKRFQKWVLLGAGYAFYGVWDARFLVLVSLSTVLDYCTGLMIAKGRMTLTQRLMPTAHLLGFTLLFLVCDWRALQHDGSGFHFDAARFFAGDPFGIRVFLIAAAGVAIAHVAYPWLSRLPEATRRRFFLRASLFGQLGMLGFFKYYNFFIDSADEIARMFGTSAAALHLDIILPVGISFYTFQTLTYVIDIYWRRMEPVEKLRDFALFASYFPPLVAGPIERAAHLIPLLLGERRVSLDHFTRGSFLILLGLLKKVAIADSFAGTAASVFQGTGHISFLDAWVGIVAFSIQVYGDFSGYSDIATGVSLFFGVQLMKNFDLPFFSTNPTEMWQRWHISLSSWLRDYLYIPLGGNRAGSRRTSINLFITMVVAGLWHGANWTFVLFGAGHGISLIVHRYFFPNAKRFEGSLLRRLPWMALYFFGVWSTIGFFFPSPTVHRAFEAYGAWLTGFGGFGFNVKSPTASGLLALPLLVAIEVAQFQTQDVYINRRLPLLVRGAFYALMILLVVLGSSNEGQQFLYFQF